MSVTRKILKINGADRSFTCNPEKDTLADVLRNLGLTGTKVGCGTGQCGACNVILNGKLIRSCVKKIKAVADYSTVYTIEGMGTVENLHPIQLAWIVYGGVQCGFCSPGFIVSSKALLDENPNPTRDDVRAWFQKNRNACRCTGYKPLVDAVMAAAKVLRGEMTMEELSYEMPDDQRVFNTRCPKPTALGKVLGTVDFGEDINLKSQEMLQLAPVMPEISHGIIKSIDTSEAEKAPGVFKIITSKDVKGNNRINTPIGTSWAINCDGFDRPILCENKVRRLGDIVAVVAADTRRHAREAAKLVKVICEPLPEYLDVLDAVKEDAVEIHPGTPNMFLKRPLFHGQDTREVIPKAAHVAEFSIGTPQQSHLPIEPDTGSAYIEEDGTVTIMCKTHYVYGKKIFLAAGIGMPPDKIRVILNPSGGSFGYSFSPGTAAILAVCAMATGRPVGLTFSYAEHQLFTGKRASSYSNVRIACDENGKLMAGEMGILYSNGFCSEWSNGPAVVSQKYFLTPYSVPSARVLSAVAYANIPQTTAYRCPNVVEVYSNVEQAMDILAEKAGIDPFEFRYINVWREGEANPVFGEPPRVFVVPGIMDQLKPKYEELKDHASKNSTPEKRLGVGVALGSFSASTDGDGGKVALELNSDGSVTSYNTWEDMGQGADIGALAMAHEALRPLGLSPDQIKLVMNDTATCPDTGRAAASRSNLINQQATKRAANLLMDAMRKPDGTFRTYEEMVAENIETKYIGEFVWEKNTALDENTGFGRLTPDQSYMAFVAEVEVDVNTGKTKVIEMHCATDIGVITNYLSVEGQAYGGMQHSIGYALSEDFTDMKKHLSLIGAGFPYIESMPDGDHFTLITTETPRDYTELGGSGCSEGFQSSGHAAVLNAIYNAVGIRVGKLPASPDKVKEAIEAKKNGTYQPQEKYDLGFDFDESLDDMKANPPAKYEGAQTVEH